MVLATRLLFIVDDCFAAIRVSWRARFSPSVSINDEVVFVEKLDHLGLLLLNKLLLVAVAVALLRVAELGRE